MKTVITLGDMERRGMRLLEVTCRKCERRGRLRIDRLMAQHGQRRSWRSARADRAQLPPGCRRHLQPLRTLAATLVLTDECRLANGCSTGRMNLADRDARRRTENEQTVALT